MAKNKAFFENLYHKYNRKDLVSPDPLEFLHRWTDTQDREIAALIGACFAYGNVKAITKNLNGIFARMPAPRTYILTATPAKLNNDFDGFKYRFTTQREWCGFLLRLKTILKKYGSLEACFLSGLSPADANICRALTHFAHCLREGTDIHTLVPDPDKKSAMKRLNLFLRWMVRQDEVDPGGWQVSPRLLVVPLDVHMHRCARALGLTKRNSADMTTALDITRNLAKFCPEDPVKYDFCITRFGIRPDMDEKALTSACTADHASKKRRR